MTENKQQMSKILGELKTGCCACALKAEFETEGASFEEALLLKELALENGLEFVLKIGGCEAVRDLRDARALGADIIVAPMIESAYAVKKFDSAIKRIYPIAQTPRRFINIETLSGFESFDKILLLSQTFDGVVFGRTDMSCSCGVEVNSEQMFEYAQILAQKTCFNNLEFVIGGGVDCASLDFFGKFKIDRPLKTETRKVVFADAKRLSPQGITKALEFELLWLESRKERDVQRIDVLKHRLLNY